MSKYRMAIIVDMDVDGKPDMDDTALNQRKASIMQVLQTNMRAGFARIADLPVDNVSVFKFEGMIGEVEEHHDAP